MLLTISEGAEHGVSNCEILVEEHHREEKKDDHQYFRRDACYRRRERAIIEASPELQGFRV